MKGLTLAQAARVARAYANAPPKRKRKRKAARPLKVFGWRGWRTECPPAPNGSQQTREIVAARSLAEAARLGETTPYQLRMNGSETGNETEVKLALSKPGKVFWQPLSSSATDKDWREDP